MTVATIERVRASLSGRAALEAYINEVPCNDVVTPKEATLLAIAPDPHEWVDYREFRADLKSEGFTDIEDVFGTLRRLEDRKLLEVFREITDATIMRIVVGSWTFYQQWTALRKQITGDNNAQHPALKPIHEAIRQHGFVVVQGKGAITIQVSVA